jgi:hypothetical protein
VTPLALDPTFSAVVYAPVAHTKTRFRPEDCASAMADPIDPSGDACVPVPVPPGTTNTPNVSLTMHGSVLGSLVSPGHSLLQRL